MCSLFYPAIHVACCIGTVFFCQEPTKSENDVEIAAHAAWEHSWHWQSSDSRSFPSSSTWNVNVNGCRGRAHSLNELHRRTVRQLRLRERASARARDHTSSHVRVRLLPGASEKNAIMFVLPRTPFWGLWVCVWPRGPYNERPIELPGNLLR